MAAVKDTLLTYLPHKRKQSPSGWVSFDSVCCHHNGHTKDTRGRGGVIANGDSGISYHCFNCGYKTSWQPGRNVSYKMKKLFQWCGVPDDVITRVALDVLRENEGVETESRAVRLPEFSTVPLPDNATSLRDITEFDKYSTRVLEYIAQRNLELDDTDYHWSSSLGYRDRLIVPFYYEGRTVGWTARSVTPDKKPKYLSEQQTGFVYGLDWQTHDRQFVLVCEGQLDAIHVQGCALGGSEISEQQALLLERLGKRIIVIPDRDQAGLKLAEAAIDQEWSVSLPQWAEDINDISDAVAKYGRLYTLYSIASSAESSPLKIKLAIKKWFG